MFGIAPTLVYLLLSWILVTTVLACLLVYGKMVSAEEDRFYMKRLENEKAAIEEQTITEKLNRLKRREIPLAVLSAVLLLATTAVWIYLGLRA